MEKFSVEELENEIWKDIEGYEGLYQVSNLGRVKSLDHYGDAGWCGVQLYKGAMLKPLKHNNGYEEACLWKNNKPKKEYIHRLVARAFIPNPEGLSEINHKDEDKTNNRASNLEWCTHKYNINYGTRNKRHGEKVGKPVIQLTLDGKPIKEWKSISEASRVLGIYRGCIYRSATHYPYKYRYPQRFKWEFKEKQ